MALRRARAGDPAHGLQRAADPPAAHHRRHVAPGSSGGPRRDAGPHAAARCLRTRRRRVRRRVRAGAVHAAVGRGAAHRTRSGNPRRRQQCASVPRQRRDARDGPVGGRLPDGGRRQQRRAETRLRARPGLRGLRRGHARARADPRCAGAQRRADHRRGARAARSRRPRAGASVLLVGALPGSAWSVHAAARAARALSRAGGPASRRSRTACGQRRQPRPRGHPELPVPGRAAQPGVLSRRLRGRGPAYGCADRPAARGTRSARAGAADTRRVRVRSRREPR